MIHKVFLHIREPLHTLMGELDLQMRPSAYHADLTDNIRRTTTEAHRMHGINVRLCAVQDALRAVKVAMPALWRTGDAFDHARPLSLGKGQSFVLDAPYSGNHRLERLPQGWRAVTMPSELCWYAPGATVPRLSAHESSSVDLYELRERYMATAFPSCALVPPWLKLSDREALAV